MSFPSLGRCLASSCHFSCRLSLGVAILLVVRCCPSCRQIVASHVALCLLTPSRCVVVLRIVRSLPVLSLGRGLSSGRRFSCRFSSCRQVVAFHVALCLLAPSRCFSCRSSQVVASHVSCRPQVVASHVVLRLLKSSRCVSCRWVVALRVVASLPFLSLGVAILFVVRRWPAVRCCSSCQQVVDAPVVRRFSCRCPTLCLAA